MDGWVDRIGEPLAQHGYRFQSRLLGTSCEQSRTTQRAGLERWAEIGALDTRHCPRQVRKIFHGAQCDLCAGFFKAQAAGIRMPYHGTDRETLAQQIEGGRHTGLASSGGDKDFWLLHHRLLYCRLNGRAVRRRPMLGGVPEGSITWQVIVSGSVAGQIERRERTG